MRDLLFQVTGAEPLSADATGGETTTGGGTTTGVAGGAATGAGAVAAAGGFMGGGATTGGTKLPPAMPMLLSTANGLKMLEMLEIA
jgi:hypothetical protein